MSKAQLKVKQPKVFNLTATLKDTPTAHQYIDLDEAYTFFNTKLFKGALPPVFITFQRQKKSYGYYWHNKLQARHGETKISEIALAINNFTTRNDKEIFSTLVHEMVHHWQHCFGKPSRPGWHNLEFADMMEYVGLMASSTGEPGGKRAGQKMSHYIITGGRFELACAELEAQGIRINWQSYEPAKPAKPKKDSKMKYTCPDCEANAWGKPELNLECGDCQVQMRSEE